MDDGTIYEAERPDFDASPEATLALWHAETILDYSRARKRWEHANAVARFMRGKTLLMESED